MNYEFKGTPGPWGISVISKNMLSSDKESTHTSVHIEGNGLALGSTLGINYKDGSKTPWSIEDHALPNACLMAAAPCLLEALNAFLDFPEVDLKEWADGDGNVTITLQPCHIKQALDSIHKALNINQ